MESHKIWIANLQDMVMNHVCQGFIKTYNELFRMCKGHKIKISVQTAMEGIPHLSMHKINADYKILLESLFKINFDESNLTDLIKNCYSSYALSALNGAGIKCKKINAKYLTGPQGSAFIHEIYINVARVVWTQPNILIEKNMELLKLTVKDAVEKSIRDGVNLKFLSTVACELEPMQPVPSLKRVVPLTLKEQFSKTNKSILDDDSDESIITDDDDTNIVLQAANIVGIPEMMASNSEMTIDDDEYAPDNATINISQEKSSDQITLASEYTVFDNSKDVRKANCEIEVKLDGLSDDGIPDELVTGVITHNDMKDSNFIDEDLDNNEGLQLNIKTKDLTCEEVTTSDVKEEDFKDFKDDHDEDQDEDQDEEQDSDESSLSEDASVYYENDAHSIYSVTLLSESDMLSSRLEKIGTK